MEGVAGGVEVAVEGGGVFAAEGEGGGGELEPAGGWLAGGWCLLRWGSGAGGVTDGG